MTEETFKEINVINRHGQAIPLDMTLIDAELKLCCNGIPEVSPSEISAIMKTTIVNGCTTKEIQDMVIKAAGGLTPDNHNYDKVAARAALRQLYKSYFEKIEPDYKEIVPFIDFKENHTENKEFYKKKEADFFLKVWKAGVEEGYYSKEVYDYFTEKERKTISTFISFEKDLKLTRAAIKQVIELYLYKNKFTSEVKELPQIANLLISVSLFYKDGYSSKLDKLKNVFSNKNSKKRLSLIKSFYENLSDLKISLSTPIRSLLRIEGVSQYISCMVMSAEDSIPSLVKLYETMAYAISNGAGLGVGLNLRSNGDPIKDGRFTHTGYLPFLKLIQQNRLTFQQGSLRSGNANFNFEWWNPEALDLIVAQDEMLPPEKCVKHIDLTLILNKFLLERAAKNQEVVLFSKYSAPDLVPAFYSKDPKEFEKVYKEYETAYYNKDLSRFASPPISSIKVNAIEYLERFTKARTNAQKLYYSFIDNINSQGTFKIPIYLVNLCVEITLPTANLIVDPITKQVVSGEVATCILGAINLSLINNVSDMEEPAKLLVRALDNLIEIQKYPVETTEHFTKGRRSLGIGVAGQAHYLAKKHVKQYSEESFDVLHEVSEGLNYFCTKASVELARERGPCKYFKDTIFSDGKLLIDVYNKKVDSYCKTPLKQDWEGLRSLLKKYGIRNSTVTAYMPSEASAVALGTVNGIVPPVAPTIAKHQPTIGYIYVPTPDYEELKDYYRFSSIEGVEAETFMKCVGIMQKFVCQSISAEQYRIVDKNAVLSSTELVSWLFYASKYGIKTMYYDRTIQAIIKNSEEENTLPDPVEEKAEEICEACSI